MWAADREKSPLVIEFMKLTGIEIAAAGAIVLKSIILPAIPKPENDLHEFAGTFVSFSNIVVFVSVEVETRRCIR